MRNNIQRSFEIFLLAVIPHSPCDLIQRLVQVCTRWNLSNTRVALGHDAECLNVRLAISQAAA